MELAEQCIDGCVCLCQGRRTPEELRDEARSRTSSALWCLSAIACFAPAAEKKALVAICQLTCEKSLEVAAVAKVSSFKSQEIKLPYQGFSWFANLFASIVTIRYWKLAKTI